MRTMLVGMVATALWLWAWPAVGAEKEGHYLCLFTLAEGRIALKEAKAVAEPLKRPRTAMPVKRAFRFALIGPNKETLHEGFFADPRQTRAESMDEFGRMRRANVRREKGTFPLHLPYAPKGSTLVVELARTETKDGKTERRYVPFAALPIDLAPPAPKPEAR
ncbi:MAG: hypothetical protein C4523_12190 [Myxococcales bacterium]|nr:MAG: hypothetical protein C4523_12190 [Myxococcales bacterium]